MVTQTPKETVLNPGQSHIAKSPRELLKAVRVATSIVVVIYDASKGVGGMIHMAMPDSHIATQPGESAGKYVDLALPPFLADLRKLDLVMAGVKVKIIGGSQLFNFGGGSGNLLNIGTRNAITARTLLTREGWPVEKTETGGNKPRTVVLDMSSGMVQVFHPGEAPRTI